MKCIKTNDGGNTWVPKGGSLFTNSQTGQITRGCRDDKGDSFWFGTSSGEMIMTNDRGNTWQVVKTLYDSCNYEYANSFGDFSILDNNTAMYVNFNSGKIYKTTDGFITEQYVGDPGFGIGTCIEKIPNTNIWLASGSFYVPGAVRGSKYSIDYGVSWISISDKGRASIKSLGLNATFAYGWDGIDGVLDYWRVVKLSGNIAGSTVETPPGTPIPPTDEDPFFIFPIPTADYLYVNSKIVIDSYQIWDTSGRLIASGKPGENKIYVAWLPKADYIVKVKHLGIEHVRKIIKL